MKNKITTGGQTPRCHTFFDGNDGCDRIDGIDGNNVNKEECLTLLGRPRCLTPQKGFTLVEMLAVLAIFGILTAVIVFNYGSFNSNIILSNTAYEIALEIREAQVYSIGVRSPAGEGADFSNRYGVYFYASSGEKTKNFLFFRDANRDGFCNKDESYCAPSDITGDSNEAENLISIERGIFIESICLQRSGGQFLSGENMQCAGESVEDVFITFERPNPDAIIKSTYNAGRTYTNAAIFVASGSGTKRAILINQSGQISVKYVETQ
jgi:prepilin-type N-terminal cleavage/methylation domain-containing protein